MLLLRILWALLAHDICSDCADFGVGEYVSMHFHCLCSFVVDVTMYQRSSTCVLSVARGILGMIPGMLLESDFMWFFC